MIAKVHTTNEMADDIEDIFVWGEDLKLFYLYDDFLQSGNLDTFYSQFYTTVPLSLPGFFCGLSRQAATLLSSKVADSLIASQKKER